MYNYTVLGHNLRNKNQWIIFLHDYQRGPGLLSVAEWSITMNDLVRDDGWSTGDEIQKASYYIPKVLN